MKNKIFAICKCIVSYIIIVLVLNVFNFALVNLFMPIPSLFKDHLLAAIFALIGLNINKFLGILFSIRFVAKKRKIISDNTWLCIFAIMIFLLDCLYFESSYYNILLGFKSYLLHQDFYTPDYSYLIVIFTIIYFLFTIISIIMAKLLINKNSLKKQL